MNSSPFQLVKGSTAEALTAMSSNALAEVDAGIQEERLAPDAIDLEEEKLLAVENEVCSHGDTVHYAEKPKIFEHCEGSYLYDGHETPYLDLQMWYSAVNLGYGNARVNNALKRQIDKLPQLACQYLHREKIELAEKLV